MKSDKKNLHKGKQKVFYITEVNAINCWGRMFVIVLGNNGKQWKR